MSWTAAYSQTRFVKCNDIWLNPDRLLYVRPATPTETEGCVAVFDGGRILAFPVTADTFMDQLAHALQQNGQQNG